MITRESIWGKGDRGQSGGKEHPGPVARPHLLPQGKKERGGALTPSDLGLEEQGRGFGLVTTQQL